MLDLCKTNSPIDDKPRRHWEYDEADNTIKMQEDFGEMEFFSPAELMYVLQELQTKLGGKIPVPTDMNQWRGVYGE